MRDKVFGIQPLGSCDFATGLKTDLVGKISPRARAIGGEPPPWVVGADTDAFGKSPEHCRGIDFRPDGDRHQVNVFLVGKGVPNFEHLSSDAGAAVWTAGVGVGENDCLAVQIGEVLFGAEAVYCGKGVLELTKHRKVRFSFELKARKRVLQKDAASGESEEKQGNEDPKTKG